jgi:predicted nucleic acid-binding protein
VVLVLDASFAVNVCLSQAGFNPLASEELVAPPLLFSEASSALHELRWRRAASAPAVETAFDRLRGAPVSARRPRRLLTEAWWVADELGLAKTYDAEYVALARLLDCRLVTVDARLRRTAQRVAAVVGPTEL